MNNNQCLVLVFCLNDPLDCELFEAKDLILQKSAVNIVTLNQR